MTLWNLATLDTLVWKPFLKWAEHTHRMLDIGDLKWKEAIWLAMLEAGKSKSGKDFILLLAQH